MRTYSYQTTGVTIADQLSYRNTMIEKQNALVTGGTTVPQFSTAGLPVGPGPNVTIQRMAAVQEKMDAGNAYSGCSGKAAGQCGGRTRRSRRSRRSRQKKMKSKKKSHKI